MRGRAWGIGALALLTAGCGTEVFSCQQDSECQGPDSAGVCAQGHCAFPSEECESGLKFGEGSGSLSGSCVLPDDSSSGGSTSSDSAGTTTTTPASTGSSSTSADADSSSSSALDTSAEDTSTGPGSSALFVDDTQEDFEAGVPKNVVIQGGTLSVGPSQGDGTFDSRVFDAGADAAWQTLSWTPEAPYGKPLPDAGAVETGYVRDGVDMSANILLMHFDHTAVQGIGSLVPDSSGNGNDGMVVGASLPPTTGVFSNAADDNLESYVSIQMVEGGDFQLGTDDFTFSIWFAYTGDCATNNVFMGADNAGNGDTFGHLWLGCSDSHSACPDDGQVRIAGTLTADHSSENYLNYCSQSVVNDGQWHHAVMVKSGHAPASIRLYLDGVLEYEGGGSFTAPILFPDLPDFVIGGFSRGTYPTSGQFDEAAVWRRALSEDEAVAMYRRGTTRLGLQVRSCTSPDCSDGPAFVGGPDMQVDRAYEDPANALAPASEVSVDGLEGRYIQYRVGLDGTSGVGPVLDRVELVGSVE